MYNLQQKQQHQQQQQVSSLAFSLKQEQQPKVLAQQLQKQQQLHLANRLVNPLVEDQGVDVDDQFMWNTCLPDPVPEAGNRNGLPGTTGGLPGPSCTSSASGMTVTDSGDLLEVRSDAIDLHAVVNALLQSRSCNSTHEIYWQRIMEKDLHAAHTRAGCQTRTRRPSLERSAPLLCVQSCIPFVSVVECLL
jgi:hypothetical protein